MPARAVVALGLCLSLAVAGLAGCKPKPLTDNGVVGWFGGLGVVPGRFSYPRALAIHPVLGDVFVVDKSGRIQRFKPDGALVASWRLPEVAAGKPVGLSVHPDGRLFVADTHYHRVLIEDVEGNLLGSFGEQGSGPGQFELPTDVAFDAEGNIYVGEYGGNDRITKWSPGLECIGVIGDEPIDGMRFRRPAGIDIDDEQTLWVADACNHRVVRLTLDGKWLKTIGMYGSQPGQTRYPYDLDVTEDGTLLVCEFGGHRVQWLSRDGEPLRAWGEAGRNLGQLFAPWGAAEGPDGRTYIVDSLNHRVQILGP